MIKKSNDFMKKNVFFRITVLIVVFLVICVFVVVYKYHNPEKYEYNEPVMWKEQVNQEFFRVLFRAIDPIHLRYYSLKTKEMSNKKAVDFISKDVQQYRREVDDTRRVLKNKTIVIAGLIMNGASQITEMRRRCMDMVVLFKDYRIVIVENNSIDNTREMLLKWVEEDPKVTILCQDAVSVNTPTCDIPNFMYSGTVSDSSPRPERIARMAFLRNVYMDHIQQYLSSFDFMCVMDLDLRGELYIDGFVHGFRELLKRDTDAVSCNGVIRRDDGFYYYDSFAFIDEYDPIMWENISEKSTHDNWVHIHVTHRYSSQMIPDKVRSAFGGISIYKLGSVLKNRYNYSSTHYCCEHSFFHDGLTIYVDPRFIFFIERNGN